MTDGFKNIFFIDIETSGPKYFESVPLNVSIVPFDSSFSNFEAFIRYQDICWAGRGREFFDDYRSEWERKAVSPERFCQGLNSYFQDVGVPEIILTGHNISFDIHFLNRVYSDANANLPQELSHRTIDTHTLLFLLAHLKKIPTDATSSDSAFNLFGLTATDSDRHTATFDALLTKKLFKRILEIFEM